jgi:hypothetical protein
MIRKIIIRTILNVMINLSKIREEILHNTKICSSINKISKLIITNNNKYNNKWNLNT